MQNITLLSLAIFGSFQRSPFLQISSSTKPCFSVLKNINAQQFFSSFLITQTLRSYSIVEDSIFNRFITSHPVLAFASNDPNIDKSYYGDTIPKDDNKFYQTNFTLIQRCKFMSITDNTQEQLLPDVGLCIYTKKNTTVDSCYFFAIQSYRSGSAILFDQEDQNIVNSVVKNSIFKSMTQTLIDFGNTFLTGGAVSYGRAIVQDNSMIGSFVHSATTDNCCFEKIRLVGNEYNGRQLGLVTYLSNSIESSNLNFTDNEMGGQTQRYGAICVYLQQISNNSISFINVFDSEFTIYGTFSVMLSTTLRQDLSLSFANFINNSAVDDQRHPIFGVEHQLANETYFNISNIQCNSDLPFFGISQLNNNSKLDPIKVTLSNSVFSSNSSTLSNNNQYFLINYDDDDNNKFDFSTFDVDITNDIIGSFGYIKTSFFSASNSFSNPFVQDSASYYDLSQDNPITAGVLATIFGIISFIVFIFLLCVRRSTRKREYEQVGDFNDENGFNNGDYHKSDDEDTNGGDKSDEKELKDIDPDVENQKSPSKKKKRRSHKQPVVETINTFDGTATNDIIEMDKNDQNKDFDETFENF